MTFTGCAWKAWTQASQLEAALHAVTEQYSYPHAGTQTGCGSQCVSLHPEQVGYRLHCSAESPGRPSWRYGGYREFAPSLGGSWGWGTGPSRQQVQLQDQTIMTYSQGLIKQNGSLLSGFGVISNTGCKSALGLLSTWDPELETQKAGCSVSLGPPGLQCPVLVYT